MIQILETIKSDHQQKQYPLKNLLDLVAWFRKQGNRKNKYTHHLINDFKSFIAHLQTDKELNEGVKNLIEHTCLQNNPLIVFTDVGIMSSKGFWAELSEKVSYKMLPPLQRKGELRTIINEVFHQDTDYKWLWQIPDSLWFSFMEALGLFSNTKIQQYWINEMLNGIVVVSQRITALGLEPEIIAKLPDMDDLSSPFLTLSMEITHFIDSYRNKATLQEKKDENYKQILIMIRQCEASINRLHKDRQKYGVGLRITYFILRLTQNIERLKLLLSLLQANTPQESKQIAICFFRETILAENQKYSVSKHLSDNLGFLAYKIAEHTAKTGEHYITNTKKEYFKLFRYALGGGFIVAFLVLFKAQIANMSLSPFGYAFFYSLNYSLGFMLIHILHFTLATKQPAMTASHVAEILGAWKDSKPNSKDRNEKIQETALLITRLIRSQFISLVGNVLMVTPIAFGLLWLYFTFFKVSPIPKDFAIHLIEDLSPWHSLALFHSAIAGLYLAVSGFIAGYYDNKFTYENVGERIRKFSFLRKIMPTSWFLKFVKYLENNYGALAGNFYLGIFLGATSNVGKFLGLPLDIRHVTFAAGNLAIALAYFSLPIHTEWYLDTSYILETILGIFLIGLVNVSVSFSISVVIGLKSRNITFDETQILFKYLFKEFLRTPFSFFFPPQQKKS
ncbi:MAG: hypothetical protein SFU27_09820 [Thermonemataceae bacterium]|nr:hypothetical protein [Thermonemataceae bacterium]